MKRRRFLGLYLSAWLLTLAWGASAKTPPPIHFTVTATPSPVHPGEVVTVTVKATVDPGWHVYSVVPTPNGPAATEIVSAGTWTVLGPTAEDTPTRKLDPNFGLEVGFHEGQATFARPFRAPTRAAPSAPLPITVHYQTCNDKICLPPTDVVLPATVSVTPGAVRAEYGQAQTAQSTSPPGPLSSREGEQ